MNPPGFPPPAFAQAVQLLQQGDLGAAESRCRQLAAALPPFPPAFDLLGNILLRQGRAEEAEKAFRHGIGLDPRFAPFHVGLAAALSRLGRHAEAEPAARHALTLVPGEPRALSVLGGALRNLKKYAEAEQCARAVLAANPSFPPAHADLGAALEGQERNGEALACFEAALRLAPGLAEAWCAKGRLLFRLGRPQEAEGACGEALRLRPRFATAFSGLGDALAAQGRQDEAGAAYAQAVALAPDDALVHSDLGLWQWRQGRLEAAEASLGRALTLKPDFTEAACHLGSVLQAQFRLDAATRVLDRALEMAPDNVEALVCLGRIQLEAGRDGEACALLSHALELAPEAEGILDMVVLARLQLCDWAGLVEGRQRLIKRMAEDRMGVNPFVAILAGADSATQLPAARRWAKAITPADAPLFHHLPAEARRGERLRIGYMSSDLHEHPLAQLVIGVFEHHDRGRFDLRAYSLGYDDQSRMRRRIAACFEEVVQMDHMGAGEAARRIHADGIHILVDLNGYTNHGNPAVLAHRPAPVQVNFQGYPATMGAAFMDYIVGDPVTLPFAEQPFFTERIVHLPHSYHPDSVTRAMSPQIPSRAQCGLPGAGFVFCCFNNAGKFTPEVFAVWMRLLKAVPDSVLWLLDRNGTVKDNILAQVAAHGVERHRVVLAPRVPLPDHLARQTLADLFLDTLPYNAHTTASDALWAGLPLLTCRGNAFAGRVAAGLLRVAGLSELIAESLEEYEEKALVLATDRSRLMEMRTRLAAARSGSALFDAGLYTRHLEAAYDAMWERWQAGLDPAPFAVPA